MDGLKLYYKRRVPSSHCLDGVSQSRSEPCACSLSDFECLPGYKRSNDGICLPKPRYIFAQDCTCNDNSTTLTKPRGYTKSVNNQCRNGVEKYLSDVYITRRDLSRPNFFIYGIDSLKKRPLVEIHTNQFDEGGNDDDDDEAFTQNVIWFVDPTYEITALVFDNSGKLVYMAVEHDQLAIVYRMSVSENILPLIYDRLSFFLLEKSPSENPVCETLNI